MTESNHTPGPWKYGWEAADKEWAVVTASGGAIVANVNTETGPSAISVPAMQVMPAVANARLISAAPDLLAACEAMVSVIEHVAREHPCEMWLGSEYLAGRAAITKARQG